MRVCIIKYIYALACFTSSFLCCENKTRSLIGFDGELSFAVVARKLSVLFAIQSITPCKHQFTTHEKRMDCFANARNDRAQNYWLYVIAKKSLDFRGNPVYKNFVNPESRFTTHDSRLTTHDSRLTTHEKTVPHLASPLGEEVPFLTNKCEVKYA